MVPRITRGFPVPVSNMLDRWTGFRIDLSGTHARLIKVYEKEKEESVQHRQDGYLMDPSSAVTKEAATMELRLN